LGTEILNLRFNIKWCRFLINDNKQCHGDVPKMYLREDEMEKNRKMPKERGKFHNRLECSRGKSNQLYNKEKKISFVKKILETEN